MFWGMNKRELSLGTQIVYIPGHAHGDTRHPDCEAGFVTSVKEQDSGSWVAYCRYWYPDGTLRTRANSEATPLENIEVRWTYPQSKIEKCMDELGMEK